MFHTLTLSAVKQETQDSVSLEFAVPSNLKNKFVFSSGQYLTLKNDDVRRSYSLCTAPHENRLKVAIKAVDGGLFSNFALNLKAGDTLDVMPPQGRFTFKQGDNQLFIAIGSGITPILSLIKHALLTTNAKITLIYGNKTTASIMFREELEDLKDKHLERLTIHHILSREASDFALLTGRITAEKVMTLIGNEKFHHAYICGAEELLAPVQSALKEKGITNIHFEIFTPAEGKRGTAKAKAEITSYDCELTLRYDGNAHLIPMSMEETVLDAATRHGLDLPFSCKGGMCCTCRAHVSEGEAKMDVNYSLEEWEQQAGFTLTCQAKPLSKKITIDFDRV